MHMHISPHLCNIRHPPYEKNLVEKHCEEWSTEKSLFGSSSWVLFSFFTLNLLEINFGPLKLTNFVPSKSFGMVFLRAYLLQTTTYHQYLPLLTTTYYYLLLDTSTRCTKESCGAVDHWSHRVNTL